MADTAIAITAGVGTNVDTRTEATNSNHRQVVVLGDPSVNAGVAPVDGTAGLSVNVTNATLTVASHAVTNAGTFAVQAAATVASGGIASGAIASGAVASGAIASGAIAAGAIAAGATSIAENEDVASADGDRGVKVMFKRLATPANSSGTDGDYEQPQMSAGRVWTSTTVDAALPAGTNAIGKLAANSGVDIGDVDITSVPSDPFGANADAASVSGSISAKLRAIATAIGTAVLTRGAGASDSGTLRMTIDSGQLGSLGQTTASASVPVAMASDRQNSRVFSVAMSADTSILASGDLIADTQQLDAFFNKADGRGVINSLTIVEKDAQGAAYYVMFHRTSTSLGTENGAPNISDANMAASLQGIVAVATTDFVTVSGTKVATLRGLGIPVIAASGTDDLYVSIMNSTGTPTYASGEIQLVIGALLD